MSRSRPKPRLRLPPRDACGQRSDSGGTLIEVIVTLAILAILAVAVFPYAVVQLQRIQANRAVEDFQSLELSLNLFAANLFVQPKRIEHLVRTPTATDSTLTKRPYTARETRRWLGPYLERRPITTGFDGTISNFLTCYDINTSLPSATCQPGHYVAVQVTNLIGRDFEIINDLVDGVQETDGSTAGESRKAGRLRFFLGSGFDVELTPGILYYLAAPFTGG